MAEVNKLETTELESIQYIVVKIGSEQYGIDISLIDNIVRLQKITRVPKAPFHYRGIINLRGEVVPVMSLRRKMGLGDDEFANRISTNYIRHECTNYDMVLGALDGKVGRSKAYEIIKEKVNQTIKNQHEWLKFDYHQ